MTKSQEKGENEITLEAKRLAALTGEDVCDILREMMKKAKSKKDKKLEQKIKKAEKYLAERWKLSIHDINDDE